MPVKKIVFYIMCGLLVTMLIISGITIGKAGVLIQGILNPAPPATDPPSTIIDTTGPADTAGPNDTTAPPTNGSTDPEHQHSFSVYKTSPATCTEGGYTLYKCSCGDTDMRDMTDALGHSFGAGKVVTACVGEDACYTQYECARCKYLDKRDISDGIGHKFDQEEKFPATCTVDAHTVRKCSNPNCNETETVTVPNTALGHKYKLKEEEAATCYKDGYKLTTCTNPGCTDKPIKETIPATNAHDFGNWADGNTCKTPGCDIKLRKQHVGNTCVIEIHAGNGHKLYSYTIVDERSSDEQANHPVSYKLVEKDGLVVSYTGADGQPQNDALGFKDNSLTIGATNAPAGTPTEPTVGSGNLPNIPNGLPWA